MQSQQAYVFVFIIVYYVVLRLTLNFFFYHRHHHHHHHHHHRHFITETVLNSLENRDCFRTKKMRRLLFLYVLFTTSSSSSFVDERARDMLSQMTSQEKFSMMNGVGWGNNVFLAFRIFFLCNFHRRQITGHYNKGTMWERHWGFQD